MKKLTGARSLTRFLSVTIMASVLALFGTCEVTAGDDLSPTLEKLKTALAMDHRSEKNRARDDNRNALAAMDFCGLRDDMTVIEFGPGAGWYTEILGPVLNDNGALYTAYKAKWMERLDDLLAQDFMSSTHKHPIDIGWNSDEKRFEVGEISFDVPPADLALNIREYHNFNTEGAVKLNNALFTALKSGGLYCVIDHTRRHMEPRYSENRRRADPVQVILDIQEAGFRLLDSSEMFFKPDDELRYEVGRKTVTGNTDRFSLLFVKP